VYRDLSREVASHLTDFNDLTIGMPVALAVGSKGGIRKMRRTAFATVAKEDAMIRITVQYDAVERTFKLVDQEFKTLLEGDALYDLNVPLMYEEEDKVEEFIPSGNTFVAHA